MATESPPPLPAPASDGTGALIVAPTYDEKDHLASFVAQVHRYAPAADILIVDDASPDGTGALADAIAADDSRVHVMHRGTRLGLGSACVAGLTWGLDRGYLYLLEMDADLSHDPSYLPVFLAALSLGHDVVLGSRNLPEGDVVGWGLGRHVLSRGASMYARCVLGVGVQDMTTGFKAYRREALERLDVQSVHSDAYSFQIETTFRALHRGLSVCEIPIVFVERRVGRSRLGGAALLDAVRVVWRLRLEAIIGRLRRP